MYIYVLDKTLKRIGLIDNYVSLIWTTRYYTYGDFELYLPVTTEFIELLQIGYYLETTESNYVMTIESINLKTDAENGNYLTISGRSVESLLERRVVSSRMSVSDYQIENLSKMLIESNFINTSSDRIMNEIAVNSETKGFSDAITGQYFGNNVYEVISQNCTAYGYGFRMPLVNGKFTFEIYAGLFPNNSAISLPFILYLVLNSFNCNPIDSLSFIFRPMISSPLYCICYILP